MVSKKKREENVGIEQGNGGVGEYEQSREQRIKENLQRMQNLGILDLSRNLKPKPKPKTLLKKPALPSDPRRSSRIKIMPTISYFEKRVPQVKVIKEVKIEIKEGPKPEVYTEEHEKMLGDHKEAWALAVDGYDEEGNRLYDAYAGKSCHQCRQKTIGLRTKCSKCKSVQGQFCGDCLFMRYGENVVEANANPDWVCPVCRDICNCSRCRKVKGWEPTGNLFRKTLHLGFKSVAHYLIHTRGPHGKQEDKEGDLLDEKDDDNMDEDSKHDSTEKNIKHHDQQRKGDDNDVDPDYESDPLDDDNDDEVNSSEED